MESSGMTSSSSRYVRDFESLFVPIRADHLRNRARNGSLGQCQFRSLCWRYFLRCLPSQYDEWLESCIRSRHIYSDIKAKHKVSREPVKESANPSTSASAKTTNLANTANNSNEQTNQDNHDLINDEEEETINRSELSSRAKELEEERQFVKATNECDHKNVYKTIERDVVRTFPDMEFFRQTDIQEILTNVLYNFASENTHLSYKQGMHELLAALLYVLHTDYQNCLINHEGGYANELIATLLDIKHLEHDAFHLFSALMKCIEAWYQNDDIMIVPETSVTGNSVTSGSKKQQVGSVLGIKLKKISENIVKNYDSELFNHLEALQIAPQIYGIRWMRLLFGREFEFLDLLTVWDTIICDHVPMSLTDYIFASMLVTLREELVNGDYTECLNNLMRHQFKDVQYVIKLALHLRDPENNSRPRSIRKSGTQRHHNQKHNTTGRHSPDTSLTKKLSQQFISAHGYRQTLNPSSSSTYSQNSKFLPNINKFVSSIGQNIQDKTNQSQRLSGLRPIPSQNRQRVSANALNQTSHKITSESVGSSRHQPQHSQQFGSQITAQPVKEYEMREIQSAQNISVTGNHVIGKLPSTTSSSKNPLNTSTESYDDLHSIVDYCWRLLSEQIDSLQRCLPKEKGLHSEDEIFVALAQLKKVRDVLKGSLRLEDELESPVGGSCSRIGDNPSTLTFNTNLKRYTTILDKFK